MTNERWDIFSCAEWEALTANLVLPKRQKEILHCLFHGLGNKGTAQHLCISTHTVRSHLKRLNRRFKTHDRAELFLEVLVHFRKGCRRVQCPLLR